MNLFGERAEEQKKLSPCAPDEYERSSGWSLLDQVAISAH